jgi:NhaP-type Na+/H+ or K+/H+ antiporter
VNVKVLKERDLETQSRFGLWGRWVLANAFGELLGLGLTFAAGYAVIAVLGEAQGTGASLGQFLLMTATGAIEGAIVGYAQWRAMQPDLARVTRRSWLLATIFGAIVAWFFGSLPFTLMNISQDASQAPIQEPPQALVLLLAAGMGIVAGAVLSFFQWRVLRRALPKAGWWIPANSLAWMLGLPVIFAATGAIQPDTPPFQIALMLALAILLAGALVGAVHGAFLVWMVKQTNEIKTQDGQ